MVRFFIIILTIFVYQPLMAQTFYDATRVNDLANKLITELDHEINQENARLKQLSRIIESAYSAGRPSEASSAEAEANEIMAAKNKRQDNCMPNMETDVLAAINNSCSLDNMEDACNDARGSTRDPELTNILAGQSAAYNVADETAAIQTTKQEAVTLIEKLGGVINNNNQCSEKIGATAQAPCINVFERLIKAYRNGDYKQKLKTYCTPTGVDNLKTRFALIMDGFQGPASRIAGAAEIHIENRKQEIQIGKRLLTLKLIIDTVEGGLRPMRRPASLGQESGEE